ncbi:MAG: hypothetical protein K0R57_4791 [Paenibacillaceae bacterium]|jgi:hypothetical protein|nr:hypothetical protein [Paenibacillaceae bacterium]
MRIGRRIYYELESGCIIQDTGERSGSVIETTVEQDYRIYAALIARVPETVGMLQLEYGEYAEDFMACNGFRVDVSGDVPVLVFNYPDPTKPKEPPIYQVPLSQRLEQQLTDIQLALVESYESDLADKEEITSLQLALVDVYEQVLTLIDGGVSNG